MLPFNFTSPKGHPLIALISESIDKLAEQAGIREGARALLAGASVEEAAALESATRNAVREQLQRRFDEAGQLPPGISQDLERFLRPIAEQHDPAHPPVITVLSCPAPDSDYWTKSIVEQAAVVLRGECCCLERNPCPVHPPDVIPTG